MTIQPGDRLPDVKLLAVDAEGTREVAVLDLFGGKKAVLFALPGAFTATCSAKHLPGFVTHAAELRQAGAELVACLSVNDASVMRAWAEAQGALAAGIVMLADGNAAFTKAVELGVDLSVGYMGFRSQRYALIADDAVVSALHVEKPRELQVSSAEAMLAALRG